MTLTTSFWQRLYLRHILIASNKKTTHVLGSFFVGVYFLVLTATVVGLSQHA
jgi:hypothetical protein